jgi:hypothetical protein
MEMTEVMSPSAASADHHPIGLILTDDLRRNRLTVFFRLLLAIPHLVVLVVWTFVVEIVVIVAWFVAVFTARLPKGLHDFMASYLRYATRVLGYIFLLADPWPPFGSRGAYQLDARIDGPGIQGRLTILFRLILAIPAMILAGVFRNVNGIVAFFGWFYCLATGRMSEGMRNISAWLLRYEIQTLGYLLLLTGRYPSLAGAPTP